MQQPKYAPEEFERRGKDLYARHIAPLATPEQDGQFVAIDIESGSYEISPDDHEAIRRLLERTGDPQIWMARVGRRTAYRIGRRLL
jgi:hypothetical protein